MIEIRDATIRDTSYVAANLRAVDRAELLAYGADLDAPALYAMLSIEASPSFVWNVLEKGQPIATFGCCVTQWPHISQAWAWGTDRFVRAVPAITAAHEAIRRNLATVGVRRLQAAAIGTHDEAHRWLAGPMQFEREGVMRGFGSNGEDFVLYGFTRFE